MTLYYFAAESGSTMAGTPPTAEAIATMLDRLGVPHAGVTPQVEDGRITLQGTVADATTAERLVLALGNLRGIGMVIDHLTIGHHAGLLDTARSFSHLPAGGASSDVVEDQVHRATPLPGAVYGPAGGLLYQLRPGETLDTVAERYYGSATEARRLFQANGMLVQQAIPIGPGVVIRLPAH